MADSFQTTSYYKLKGVNQKISEYEFPATECLELFNLDFDVPNAWQKRPGSTFAIAIGNQASGPIQSLFEFVKLAGQSYVIAASDTALFLAQSNQSYTLLSANWNNGQPPDTLTFLDRLWIANGQSFASWNGNTFLPAGLQMAQGISILNNFKTQNANLATTWTVAGVPAGNVIFGASFSVVNLYVAYSLTRNDGYEGPINLFARDLLSLTPADGGVTLPSQSFFPGLLLPYTNGVELLDNGSNGGFVIGGFNVPNNVGISAINIYLALYKSQIGSVNAGAAGSGGKVLLGASNNSGYLGTAMPTTNQFFLFASIPPNTTAYTLTTSQLSSWSGFIFGNPRGPSGMLIDWFNTNTPKYIENFQNSLVAAGFSNTPSTVWFSNLAEPEFFDPENSDEVRTNDGDRIIAIKSFNNQLIVCKRNSFHKYLGSMTANDISSLSLVEVSLDYGCLSNKTIIAVKQKLYWLDKKGIIYYDGATFDIISTPVEQIFRRMNIAAAIEKAVGVHHIYRNQIWFSFPIDGSTKNNVTVVYDYLVNGWTFFDGFSPSSFGFIKQGLSKETVWRGDYSGLIHYFGESFFSDSSQGITCLALTRFENIGGENQTTLWRRLFLDVSPVIGLTGTISGQVFTNYNTTSVQATFSFYQNQFQTRAEMGVQGKAIAAQISFFSASLPLLINGYSWANRGLRNV